MANAWLARSGMQPRILPVRVAFEGSLPYELGALLNHLNYAVWRGAGDDDRVLGELLRAVEGLAVLPAPMLHGGDLAPEIPLPSANPRAPLEAPEGTMAPESPFYVSRMADAIIADEQQHMAGYTLTIQAPRQMGKSSMLGRVMERAQDAGKRVAFVDFQAFGRVELSHPDALYRQFCDLIEVSLDLEPMVDTHWASSRASLQKCDLFMERRILPACKGQGLLLAIDEADSVLESPFSSDFFGLLRSWHNKRGTRPQAWRSFSLAMVISTEPGMLIDNLSQSPFNVGTNVKPEDFSFDETRQVHAVHGQPLREPELKALHDLLDGHPYLTRKALYLLSKRRYQPDELLKEADSETGPFGDHLRALMVRLHMRPNLQAAMRSAVRSGVVDGPVRHRLIAGGLIKERAGRLVARNSLYERYFHRVL